MSNSDVFKYNTLFYPGNFFTFWNVLVPLSVIINIRQYGLRSHEFGLLVALFLNPIILKYVLHSPAMAWGLSIFYILWIIRELRKFREYKVYSLNFMKCLAMLTIFVAVPSLIIRAVWQPLTGVVGSVLEVVMTGASCHLIAQARDLVLLCLSVAVLLHALKYYVCYHNNKEVCCTTPKKTQNKEKICCPQPEQKLCQARQAPQPRNKKRKG